MFTKNYYKILASVMLAKTKTVYEFNAVDRNGNARPLNYYDSSYAYNGLSIINSLSSLNTSLSSTTTGLVLGTGNTTPSPDDYTLAGSIISTLATVITYSLTPSEGGTTLEITLTMTNTSAEDVTVGEICWFGHYVYGSTNSSRETFLIERTALETPVTIPADGVGRVTYTIRMNYPT